MSDLDATMIDLTPAVAEDAAMVVRVLDGDRNAMAEMYDRYADRIHAMCVHMLRDEHEAADVCGQVFLIALQRMRQLRDPERLRSWLCAITRNEVYKRSRDRTRVRPMEEVDEMQALSTDPTEFEAPGRDDTRELPGADPARLAVLVQAAAGGLDDRDRMVLELNLAQGLDGEDLAGALGVKVDNAYQMTHRMKERLERSMSAPLVVTAGREHCGGLDGVAKKWDGTYDVLWRKRFARHVDGCDTCQKVRARIPKAVLSGVALSQAAQSAVLAAPISVRHEVLAQGPAIVGTSSARAWSASGFPPGPTKQSRLWKAAAGVFVVLLVVTGLSGALGEGAFDVMGDDSAPVPSTPSTAVPGGSATTTVHPGEPVTPESPPTAPDSPPTAPGATSTVPDDPGVTTPPGGSTPETPPGEATRPTETTTTTYSYPPYDPNNPPPVFSIPMPTFYFPPVLTPPPTVPGLY